MEFTVKYYAGPYSGKRTVTAEDAEEAIEIVKARIRREMTLPMYADGYKIVDSNYTEEDSEAEED